MIINKSGDILKANENYICHQVNIQGIMGGGLARQIANLYPNVEEEYSRLCNNNKNDYKKLKGIFYNVRIDKNRIIANCFTQKPNFDTDYEAVEECFRKLFKQCKDFNRTICLPYKYGCGIANGKWNKILNIIENLSNEIGIDVNIYRLEEI